MRRLIAEHGLDPATIKGTGAGGRITRSDVLAVIEGGGGRRAAPAEAEEAEGGEAEAGAAQATKELASEDAPAARSSAAAPAAATAPRPAPAPAPAPTGRVEKVPFTS